MATSPRRSALPNTPSATCALTLPRSGQRKASSNSSSPSIETRSRSLQSERQKPVATLHRTSYMRWCVRPVQDLRGEPRRRSSRCSRRIASRRWTSRRSRIAALNCQSCQRLQDEACGLEIGDPVQRLGPSASAPPDSPLSHDSASGRCCGVGYDLAAGRRSNCDVRRGRKLGRWTDRRRGASLFAEQRRGQMNALISHGGVRHSDRRESDEGKKLHRTHGSSPVWSACHGDRWRIEPWNLCSAIIAVCIAPYCAVRCFFSILCRTSRHVALPLVREPCAQRISRKS